MKTIRNIIVLSLGLFSMSSCESMLDVEVKSEISGSTYWQSEADFEPYLYGIYGSFRGHWNNMSFAEDRGDMWVPGYNNRFSSYWAQDISASETSTWTGYYGTIGHCNLLLSHLDSFSFVNEKLKKQIKAEALTLRAAVYFYIAKIWGDVPLLLEPVLNEKEPLHPRTPVKEVFGQINKDINEALALYPEDGYKDKYRFSKPATYALQADVRLWEATVLNGGEACLDDVIKAVTEVEKSGVRLLDNYGDIFDKKKNDEIIFSFYCERSEYTSSSYNNALLRVDTGGSADNASELPLALYGQQAYCLSDRALEIIKKYELDGDKRIARTCIPELSSGEVLNWWANKFRGTKYSDDRIADNDMIVYRLAEMYLFKAEAYALKGDIPNALDYLKKIRDRAGIPGFEQTDKQIVLMEILDERGRELFHEIKRFWDLRRADASGTIDIYNYIPNLKGKNTPLYWAVHVNMMSLNDQLVQTEGYE